MSFFVAFDAVAVKTTVDTSLEMREYISPKFPYHCRKGMDVGLDFEERPH